MTGLPSLPQDVRAWRRENRRLVRAITADMLTLLARMQAANYRPFWLIQVTRPNGTLFLRWRHATGYVSETRMATMLANEAVPVQQAYAAVMMRVTLLNAQMGVAMVGQRTISKLAQTSNGSQQPKERGLQQNKELVR